MKKKTTSLKLVFASITVACVLFTGCAKAPQEAQRRTIKAGTSADYPPFEFISYGEFHGLDIDVAYALARELGYELEIKDIEFSNLIQALHSKRVDFVISSMTATEQRMKNVDFSIPYYSPSFAVISKKDAPINTEQDLMGKRIGVQLGSTMEQYAQQLSKDNNGQITIESRNLNPQLIQELLVGRIDGVVIEESQASAFVKNTYTLTYALLPKKEAGYAIAFRKGSPLKAEFDKALKELEANGKLQAIIEKWINKDYVEPNPRLEILPNE